jgi:hypothetical protein
MGRTPFNPFSGGFIITMSVQLSMALNCRMDMNDEFESMLK